MTYSTSTIKDKKMNSEPNPYNYFRLTFFVVHALYTVFFAILYYYALFPS